MAQRIAKRVLVALVALMSIGAVAQTKPVHVQTVLLDDVAHVDDGTGFERSFTQSSACRGLTLIRWSRADDDKLFETRKAPYWNVIFACSHANPNFGTPQSCGGWGDLFSPTDNSSHGHIPVDETTMDTAVRKLCSAIKGRGGESQ